MSDIKSRSDVVNEVAAQVDLPQKDVDRVLRAFESVVMRQAANGGEIRLVGFGSFKIAHRAARTSRNLHTGQPAQVAARNAIRFVPGQTLKDAAALSLRPDAPIAKPKAGKVAPTVATSGAAVEAGAQKKEKKEKKLKKKSKG